MTSCNSNFHSDFNVLKKELHYLKQRSTDLGVLGGNQIVGKNLPTLNIIPDFLKEFSFGEKNQGSPPILPTFLNLLGETFALQYVSVRRMTNVIDQG